MNSSKQVERAIRLFYVTTGLVSAYFATGVWLFFWRLYLTNGQIGLLDASCFLIGMIAEIPSGALADRLGRRRTMILGLLLMGIGYGGMGLAATGWQIWLGFAGVSIGTAFLSGADDALMYDYLKAHKQEERWETIARHKQLVKRLSAMGALVVGGYMAVSNIRWPFLARSFFFFLGILPIIAMKFMDKFQPVSSKDALVSYRKHIWTGMRELLNRRLLPVLLLVIAVQGTVSTMFIGGILRPLMLERTSLAISKHSAFLAIVTFVITIMLIRPVKVSRKSVYHRTVLWSLCVLVGFILNIPAGALAVGLLGILLIHMANAFLIPTVSTLLNSAVSSGHRATALSTASLLENLPYVIAAPLIGIATDRNMLTAVIVVLVLVMGLAIGLSVITFRRDTIKQA